ncbi:MAG: hypothetical protein GXO58_00855, partial [Thermodesulfobacteria bacterium]|nr:hypothetical protein [Thermodesulfobacteriota bacterium]
KKLRNKLLGGQKINEAVGSLFDIYEVKRGSSSQGSLLMTGYYQPRLQAAYEKGEGYKVPVLGVPRDLVRVRLRDFDTSLPAIDLWGMVRGQRLLPYYDRKAITWRLKKYPDIYPVLCWLRSPVDLLELQIQGSGIMVMDSGQERFIHYAASNGRPYSSVGRILLKRGLLARKDLDWPSIKAWAEENPKKFHAVLNENQRYVFFKWEKVGPIGCYGKVLVPGVSAALDKAIFPPGILVAVNTALPALNAYPAWLKTKDPENITLFLFNHDTGSAIKGPFRLDLYTGTGSEGGLLAGHLKNKARFFVFIPKRADNS